MRGLRQVHLSVQERDYIGLCIDSHSLLNFGRIPPPILKGFCYGVEVGLHWHPLPLQSAPVGLHPASPSHTAGRCACSGFGQAVHAQPRPLTQTDMAAASIPWATLWHNCGGAGVFQPHSSTSWQWWGARAELPSTSKVAHLFMQPPTCT